MIDEVEPSQVKVRQLPFWLILAAITVAELLTSLLYPIAGLICHGVILVSILASSAFVRDKQARNFLISLSLIPLIRIISLSMPLATIPQIYWYILIYVPLLASAIAVMWVLGIKPVDIGLTKKNLGTYIILGVILGSCLGLLEWLILHPKPLATEFTVQAILGPAFILFFTTGLVEELIFRGVLQSTSQNFMGYRGLIYVSIAFAVLHIGQLSVLDVVFVLGVALAFAWIVKWTGSLTTVIVAHGITNIMLYLIATFLFR